MSRQCHVLGAGWSATLLLVVLVAGCAAPGKPVPGPVVQEKPVIIRPVVIAETGAEELVKAVALIKDKNYLQAEANLEEIVKVRKDLPDAYFNLGWVRQQVGKHAEVTTPLRDGLVLRPSEKRAWWIMALSERELGQFEEAERSYRAALALDPNNDKLYLNLGILYDLYLMKPAEALAQYRRYQAMQKAPDPKVAGWIGLLERKVTKP